MSLDLQKESFDYFLKNLFFCWFLIRLAAVHFYALKVMLNFWTEKKNCALSHTYLHFVYKSL